MPTCDHRQGVVIDTAGRECCDACGEVIRVSSELRSCFDNTNPDYRMVLAMSSYDSSLSVSSSYLVDSVCNDCQSTTGMVFPDELKQRVMRVVEEYRRSLKGSSVSSYENVVRAGIIIILRELKYEFPVNKIATRFDKKKTPVLRTLAQMNRVLGIMPSTDNINSVFSKYLQDIMEVLVRNDNGPRSFLGQAMDMYERMVQISGELYQISKDCGIFENASVTPSQPLVCCVFVVKYGCEYKPKSKHLTMRECVNATHFTGSEKCCYRDFNSLKKFSMEAVTAALGSIDKTTDIEGCFLKNMQRCAEVLKTKIRLKSKINSLVSSLA